VSKKQDKSPPNKEDAAGGYYAGSSESKFDEASIGASSDEAAPQDAKNLAENPDSWPLQADRIAIHQPLIDCLRILAGFYGRRTSNGALTAGLPIPKDGITPEIFIRAAARADMVANLTERSLESLAIAPNLPCVLALAENQACTVWEIKDGAKKGEKDFVVQFPETPDDKQILSLEQLKALYTGYAFFVRPVARVDDRAGPAEIDTGRNWFWAVFWENRTLYAEVGIAAVMINLFGIASSLYVMNVYDKVVPNNAFETLWALAGGIFIVYITDFILKNLRAHFLDFAGRKADVVISSQLFEQILGMTMTSRPQSAGVLAANMKEFETLRDFFTSATMVALIDLPFVLLFVLIIWVIGGPFVAVVPLAAIPLIIGMGLFLQKPLEKVIKESLHESALKNALLFETIIGLETIKVQAAEGHTQRSWEELTDKASKTSVKSRQIASFAQNWAMFVQQMVSVVIVIVGVYMISDGLLTMGGLIACVILSGRAMAPLAQVSGLMTRMNQSRQALDQLDDLMKKPVERPTGKHFVTMPHMKGKVEFRDVVFNYPGQAVPALNHLSFTVEQGDKVGVIGAVGSGKTTLERLLINLYEPTSGSVQIDGSDVRQIDPGDFLYDPPILVLDEPTASMDPASENRLRKRLEMLCQNKTTILITHKGSMLSLVDKLILIDRGKLVAYGPKDDVIRKLQARQYGTSAENTEV